MIVTLDPTAAAHRLSDGTLGCPHLGCDGTPRSVGLRPPANPAAGPGRYETLRPRRARCRSCQRTQVLIEARSYPRRPDAVEAVGAALLASVNGLGRLSTSVAQRPRCEAGYAEPEPTARPSGPTPPSPSMRSTRWPTPSRRPALRLGDMIDGTARHSSSHHPNRSLVCPPTAEPGSHCCLKSPITYEKVNTPAANAAQLEPSTISGELHPQRSTRRAANSHYSPSRRSSPESREHQGSRPAQRTAHPHQGVGVRAVARAITIRRWRCRSVG